MTVGTLVLMSACGRPRLSTSVARACFTGLARRARRVALLAACVPFLPTCASRAARRIGKFEEQFPEAIDLLARALRAGHAFTTGLAMVADELPQTRSGASSA